MPDRRVIANADHQIVAVRRDERLSQAFDQTELTDFSNIHTNSVPSKDYPQMEQMEQMGLVRLGLTLRRTSRGASG
jgi:hypothetical protein